MGPRIVMIGSAPEVRGGISAMVAVYRAQGLFGRWDLRYIETHCDGGKVRKAMKAVRAWVSFMGALISGRVDLLHVHIASDASFWRKSLFIVPAHAFKVPYVLHMHGGRFLEFYRDQPLALVQRFIRRIYRDARIVIALSEGWREVLLQVSPESRIVVVPNPIAVPSWQASLDGAPPTVLYLGLVKEAKGAFDLVKAWPAVRRAVPDARLVLGGVGETEAADCLARNLGVGGSIEMPGWVVGDGKEEWVRRAWIFALPSHGEALPMAILETMAAGIPVVATRVGGVPTAVDHGVTGVLLEVGDIAALSRALIELLTDPPRRKAMGDAGRRVASEKFSADAVVPRVEALWREILD